MKVAIITLIMFLHFGQTFAQSVIWEKRLNFSFDGRSNLFSIDKLNDFHAFDTNTYFANGWFDKFSWTISGNVMNRPVMLKLNHLMQVVDTFVYNDTANGYLSCMDIQRKRIWIVLQNEGNFRSRNYRKIDFNGNTRAFRQQIRTNAENTDSLPAAMNLIHPAPDGGFFVMGMVRRRINNQNSEPWSISRFDSLGNRRWVKEYTFNYTSGRPFSAEMLPNGRLFVGGSMGRDVVGLELDTATGNILRNRVLFTHPRNSGWIVLQIKTLPNGYILEGGVGDPTANLTCIRLDDSLRIVYGSSNTTIDHYAFVPLADSSVWMIRRIGRIYHYTKVNQDSTIQFDLVLTPGADTLYNYKTFKAVAHFNNGEAILAGDQLGIIDSVSRRDDPDLLFMKIGGYGTPYNPIYPPVGPVLSSNQKQNQEPNLQVYPNPFTNTLRLSHKGTAQLLDVHGRVVISQPVEAGEELKVANLPKGMYLLRLQSVGGKLYVRKVVRE